MSSRHYGRYVGERVTYPTLDRSVLRGVVTSLSGTDNNCCFVLFDGKDKPSSCVAEWCSSENKNK